MGGIISHSRHGSKRVIWCDTEGGVRGLWDVTFIDECVNSEVRAVRFFNVREANQTGRTRIRKHIPMNVYSTSVKHGCVYASEHVMGAEGKFGEGTYTKLKGTLSDTVSQYLADRKGCVLSAWNLKAHDAHVLTNVVGKEIMNGLVLWDALPWFRSKYTLPKNTLSSDKPGTPRNLFSVTRQGIVHTSLADAAHLREVILRAAYCLPSADTTASRCVSQHDMFVKAQEEIEKQVDLQEWVPVAPTAWQNTIPQSVYKPASHKVHGGNYYWSTSNIPANWKP